MIMKGRSSINANIFQNLNLGGGPQHLTPEINERAIWEAILLKAKSQVLISDFELTQFCYYEILTYFYERKKHPPF